MDKPKFLLYEVKVCKPHVWEEDQDARTYESWYPLHTREEVDQIIAHADRPGFGKEYASVEYRVFDITLMQSDSTTYSLKPVTLLDVAHEFGGHGVKVGLKGKGWDGAAVFWDTRGNSFAVVKPKPEQEGDKRVVSDQGVILVSINGIGEVRWTVFATQGGWDENKEATAHFGLTWEKSGAF